MGVQQPGGSSGDRASWEPTAEEWAEAHKYKISLADMTAEDRAVANYLGISLVELAEVNKFFGDHLPMTEAIQMRNSPRWAEVRAGIARGHRSRLIGARIGKALQIVVLLVVVFVAMRCLGVIG